MIKLNDKDQIQRALEQELASPNKSFLMLWVVPPNCQYEGIKLTGLDSKDNDLEITVDQSGIEYKFLLSDVKELQIF